MITSIHVHAYNATPEEFEPSVNLLSINNPEAFSLWLSPRADFSIFLGRDQLARLRDVLAAACEKYPAHQPVAASEPLSCEVLTEVAR